MSELSPCSCGGQLLVADAHSVKCSLCGALVIAFGGIPQTPVSDWNAMQECPVEIPGWKPVKIRERR